MIVFLDIDGPISNPRTLLGGMRYDPINVNILNKLFAQQDVLVVLASCERIICKTADGAYSRLKNRYNIECKLHEFWCTYENYGAGENQRARELKEWISKHHIDGQTYVSIDDDLIEVDAITHIKANWNGLSFLQILHIQSLYEPEKIGDYERQLAWEMAQKNGL